MSRPESKFEVGDWVEIELHPGDSSEDFLRQWNGFMGVITHIGAYITVAQLSFFPHRGNPGYKGPLNFSSKYLKSFLKKSDIRP